MASASAATPVSYRKRRVRPMSARALERYQRTIDMSTRHARRDEQADDHDDEQYEYWIRRRPLDAPSEQSAGPSAPFPQASFIAEQSFVYNPLNTRLAPATPRAKERAVSARNGSARLMPSSSPTRTVLFPESAPGVGIPDSIPVPVGDLDTQDALLIQDLLFVLQGIEGEYITFAPGYDPAKRDHQLRGPEFVVNPAFDPSLRDLVQRVCPLAKDYVSIVAFVELESDLRFGTVVHALCASIRKVLKDYSILLAQLEHECSNSSSFTLQKLWLYIHKTLRTFTLLHAFTSEVAKISHANILERDEDEEDEEDEEEIELERQRRALLGIKIDEGEQDGIIGGLVKGGEILAMLWDRVAKLSGDPAAHELFLTLFADASQPYRAILLRWITTGHLSDPYDEFIILEDTSVTQASLSERPTDEYWEQRYTLRDERLLAEREQMRQRGIDPDDSHAPTPRGIFTGGAKVPAFLEAWKHKILLAGKYLNVLRECGMDLPPLSPEADGELDLHDSSFLSLIDQAYNRANERLLNHLLVEKDMLGRLRSAKHYFVLDQADFFLSFYEQGLSDLRKMVHSGRAGHAPMRLSQQLGMVLGSSTTVGWSDPYKEDVVVDCHGEKVYSYLIRVGETKGTLGKRPVIPKTDEQLRVMDVFQFDLNVQFPVSLVLSKSSIVRWQDLQRVVVHLKVLEHQLSQVWQEHGERLWTQRIRNFPDLETWKRRLVFLRHSMLFWVQSTLSFMTSEVIEPTWCEMLARIEAVKTVDQLMRHHFWFLNTARRALMLTDPEYVKRHSRQTQVVEYLLTCSTQLRDQLLSQVDKAENPDLPREERRLDPSVDTFLTQLATAWSKHSRAYIHVLDHLATTDNPAATPLANKLQSTRWF